MKLKVDRGLLPVKLHFFFFFAALGPILPQLNVFGRQLGVSPAAMGLVTAVLPLLWAVAKPAFGYVVDYFTNKRKIIFMLLILTMTSSYCGLWFLSPAKEQRTNTYYFNNTVYLSKLKLNNDSSDLIQLKCRNDCLKETKSDILLYIPNNTYLSTVYVDHDNATCEEVAMKFDSFNDVDIVCMPNEMCSLNCIKIVNNFYETDSDVETEDFNNNSSYSSQNKTRNSNIDIVDDNKYNEINHRTNITLRINESNQFENKLDNNKTDNIKDNERPEEINRKDGEKVLIKAYKLSEELSLYVSGSFWAFVVLMCVGTVAFNVANCIGDAVCFDVLGSERSSRYGSQRAWGTVGYGVTALLGGLLIDAYSKGSDYKDFTPAFIIALVATAVDLYSCRALKLPSLSSPSDSGRALRRVLLMPRVLVFITFAVLAGTFDSFIIYYMFWFVEELAEQSGHQAKIKMIEGIVVAGESFVGELLFFFLSGRIIKRFGYARTMSFSLFCYGIRLVLISFIYNPWHLIFIECVMQGPTYALCYSCIVGYAAHVAPPGYSATVQGVVAGMDDGLGFTIGSLLGGQLYSYAGGRTSFRVMAVIAALTAVAHLISSQCLGEEQIDVKKGANLTPEEGEKMLQDGGNTAAIYKQTTVPIDVKESINDDR